MVDKEKILAGRKAVDAYRTAHAKLYEKGWHKGIPEEHTPLLAAMVDALDSLGFTSTKTDPELRRAEILTNFSIASEYLSIKETGILEGTIRHNRKDLSLLGLTPDMTPTIIAEASGAVLALIESNLGKEGELWIDKQLVMSTIPQEHILMRGAVRQCPSNSRVFVGGLGLALVLLYLAESDKAVEIIVCEIDMRVIKLLSNQVSQWFADNYPNFKLVIIQGDALAEIVRHGKFDWVYIDLSTGAPPELEGLAQSVLTDNGVYTPYQPYSINDQWSSY